MQERLALLDRLRQAEIRATGFRVASVVGHLIGTPLNVISGRASLILSNPDPASVEQNARKIEDQVTKLTQRIRRLIEYLNPPGYASERWTIRQLTSDVVSLYGPIAEQRGVNLTIADQAVAEVLVEDGTTVMVLLTSLLSMALRAATAEATIEVSVTSNSQPRFEVVMPGITPPRGRIDSMEPPEEPDPVGAEHLRTLAVCSALARRLGGQLEVAAADPGHLRVQFTCQEV